MEETLWILVLSRPSVHSVFWTPFRTISGLSITVCEINFFQDHLEEKICNNAEKVTFGLISGPSVRNQEDTGQRRQGHFIFHHHLHCSRNILFHIDILVTLSFISRPS